jgi:hypothetical protein
MVHAKNSWLVSIREFRVIRGGFGERRTTYDGSPVPNLSTLFHRDLSKVLSSTE